MKTVRIGSGSAWEGDRIEPAVILAERGNVQYLCFDNLAERTISFAHLNKLKDSTSGFFPSLVKRTEALLPICAKKGIRLIGNWGAANPVAAAEAVKEVARRKNLKGLKVATITGDEVPIERLEGMDLTLEETGGTLKDIKGKIISANVYIGCEGIVEALRLGADVIVGGRIGDPALFIGPMVYEFKWPMDAWDLLASGQIVGHLMECGCQCTGGYFADPGFCDVPNLADLGLPLAEVSEDGSAVITKVEGTGGLVTVNTCKIQLIYEIHDPSRYISPDVCADVRQTVLRQLGKDRVQVTGTKGKPKPPTLKIQIGVLEGFIGEGDVSFAGPGAYERAQLFLDVTKTHIDRIHEREGGVLETRYDIIGMNSIFGPASPQPAEPPYDLRAHYSARCREETAANLVAQEANHSMPNGPAGACGPRSLVRPVLAIYSALIPPEMVQQKVNVEEA